MSILWELYRGKDSEIKPTLERIKKACEYIGNPQKRYPAVLVGGTNGKGSTCAFTEQILRKHGLKTGWFVSPHLLEERERWRVNGKLIQEERLKEYVKELRKVFERFGLTYFEAATLIAVKYFSDEAVDVAVFEVGMGGRWDATKVARAEVVGITNVERDHTRWLGNTVEKIAWEKLHLYTEGKPIVLGSARYPLYAKALEMGLKNPVVAGIDYEYYGSVNGERTTLSLLRWKDLLLREAELSLWGKWQIDNAAMAVVLSSFLVKPEEKKVREALSETRWEGRMEILRKKPLIMLDASHNPYAVAKVVKEVKKHFPDLKLAFSSLKGKDWELSLRTIAGYFKEIYLVPISYHRAEDVKLMAERARALGISVREISPEELPSLEENILVIGSIYLIAEVKANYLKSLKGVV
ncbi:MAG: bifunctional folylpolyglutamate synthase/dihydrofolate synthase [Aquificae bacterium]|nr:bifunctional folylpolyglutamate synthase/dihydrofolate synthase [Aquificota bacterium]